MTKATKRRASAAILRPEAVFFPRDDDHFLLNVEYYRAKPDYLADDDDFAYTEGSSGAHYIISPRCPVANQRYVVALWS